MTTQELIEAYQVAFEESTVDDSEADDHSDEVLAVTSELIGRKIIADVKWQSGRHIATEGTVTNIVGDKVYLESRFGQVEGDSTSMCAAD